MNHAIRAVQPPGLRAVLKHALDIAIDIGRTRLLLFEQKAARFQRPYPLRSFSGSSSVCALRPIRASQCDALVVPFVCGLSASGALFLILELDAPFHGLIQILSDSPGTLAQIGESNALAQLNLPSQVSASLLRRNLWRGINFA
jgi:hypothetical protein